MAILSLVDYALSGNSTNALQASQPLHRQPRSQRIRQPFIGSYQLSADFEC
jgi:hypothetical protein